jgi:beta-glucosidase
MAWYPGMEGGKAMGDIIFGDFNPCAKLPVVFPKSENQLPFFDKYADSIDYGYYHGYKLMEKNGEEPAFPFGFGLSFTTYSYKNLSLNKDIMTTDGEIEISVDITNTGNTKGEEIAQLYIGYRNSSVDRPVKDLKGFGKVTLEPGETKTMTIRLKAADLAYYDVESNDWVVEKIEYAVYIGPSSREDDLLKTTFKIL